MEGKISTPRHVTRVITRRKKSVRTIREIRRNEIVQRLGIDNDVITYDNSSSSANDSKQGSSRNSNEL